MPERKLAVLLLAALFIAAAARAGGLMDSVVPQHDPRDEGPPFFGFVKDNHGKPIADAKVTADVKDGPMVIARSDTTGLFKIGAFSRKVAPADVLVSCEKDGYRQLRVLVRGTLAAGSAKPIEVECRMERR